MTVKEFTVDVKRWARGGKNGEPALLNEQGSMCCLGFLGEACGVSADSMRIVGEPADIDAEQERELFPPDLMDVHDMDGDGEDYCTTSCFGNTLISTNDDHFISDKERMEKIQKEFRTIGIEVNFINVETEEENE